MPNFKTKFLAGAPRRRRPGRAPLMSVRLFISGAAGFVVLLFRRAAEAISFAVCASASVFYLAPHYVYRGRRGACADYARNDYRGYHVFTSRTYAHVSACARVILSEALPDKLSALSRMPLQAGKTRRTPSTQRSSIPCVWWQGWRCRGYTAGRTP